MDPKYEHHRADIERIQFILERDKAFPVTFEQAGNIWNNVSRAHGGAGWLLVPENSRIINFIQTTPGFTSYQDFIKRDLMINDEEE